MRLRYGSTLVELLVTLTIMSIVAGVVTLMLRPSNAARRALYSEILAARRSALSSRAPVTIEVILNDSLRFVTVLPDGELIADSALPFDRLTGVRLNVRP